jgi:HDOD domain
VVVSCKAVTLEAPTVVALLRRVELGEVEILSPLENNRLGIALSSDRRAVERIALHAYRAEHQVFVAWSERIWQHSLARAVAMGLLAERSQARGQVDVSLAYAAGLLADVGAPYLLRWWGDGAFGGPPLEVETTGRIAASVRAHHEAAGAALLSRWGLDPLTVHLARNHHTERPCYENPYWVLVVIAELLANATAADPDLTYGAPMSSDVRERCCAAARLSVGELRRLLVQVRVEYQARSAALAATLTSAGTGSES